MNSAPKVLLVMFQHSSHKTAAQQRYSKNAILSGLLVLQTICKFTKRVKSQNCFQEVTRLNKITQYNSKKLRQKCCDAQTSLFTQRCTRASGNEYSRVYRRCKNIVRIIKETLIFKVFFSSDILPMQRFSKKKILGEKKL